jgi:hypothetical protein
MLDGNSANDSAGLVTVESCHSTWLFDEANSRFRRTVKGLRLGGTVSTDWRPYDHLVLDDRSDAFIVFLDACGTRLLRSWRHLGPCDHCGDRRTEEISIDAVKAASATRATKRWRAALAWKSNPGDVVSNG